MAAAIKLREDPDGSQLCALMKRSRQGGQKRRHLTPAVIYDGGKCSDAVRTAGETLKINRGWMIRFNAKGPGGLIDRNAPSPERKLNDGQRAALAAKVEASPILTGLGVVRWRRFDLAQWIWEEFAVSVEESTVGRELRRVGLVKRSARPHHYAQDPETLEAFKNLRRNSKRDSRQVTGWY